MDRWMKEAARERRRTYEYTLECFPERLKSSMGRSVAGALSQPPSGRGMRNRSDPDCQRASLRHLFSCQGLNQGAPVSSGTTKKTAKHLPSARELRPGV